MNCLVVDVLIAFLVGFSDNPVDVVVLNCNDEPRYELVETGDEVVVIDNFITSEGRVLIVKEK